MHMYYILLESLSYRSELIKRFKQQDIHPTFHYIPLHNAPAGKKYARAHGELNTTVRVSDTLLRLPLWVGLESRQQEVIDVLLTM